jgi:hypothetical protein
MRKDWDPLELLFEFEGIWVGYRAHLPTLGVGTGAPFSFFYPNSQLIGIPILWESTWEVTIFSFSPFSCFNYLLSIFNGLAIFTFKLKWLTILLKSFSILLCKSNAKCIYDAFVNSAIYMLLFFFFFYFSFFHSTSLTKTHFRHINIVIYL